MARPVSPTPTDSERAILEVLWDKEEASVREVADELCKTRPVAYTTVLTVLKILSKKGLVHHRTEGRAFIYRPAITRSEARSGALRNLLTQFFGGSPEVLAQHLLSEHELDLSDLEVLRKKVAAAKSRKGGA